MKTINLIDCGKSEVGYRLTTFPDGEPHIRFTEELDRKEEYDVLCRICNPSDLFVVMQVGDILNRQGVVFTLSITYLMSMRMDRVVNFEEAFTLRIVAAAINSLNAKKVRVYEAHSERTFSEIRNCEPMVDKMTLSVLINSKVRLVMDPARYSIVYDYLCFPDAGACARYRDTMGAHLYDVCVLEKHRDLKGDGAIMTMDFSRKVEGDGYQFLLLDDLCDGGGTFVAAAELLKKEYPNSEFSILVRHMVNPRGLENLSKNYKNVFITDSYRDWSGEITEKGYENVFQISVTDGSLRR